MSYEPKIVQQAMARLERRRDSRERKRWELEQQLYKQQPRLRQLDAALRGTMVELTDLIATGKAVAPDGPEITDIRRRNLDLQTQRAELLHTLGYQPDALDDTPACKQCGDTGWNGTAMCGCLKALCAQEQMKELSSLLNLSDEQTFARARLDVYSDAVWPDMGVSPRSNMEKVIGLCRGYAQQFGSYPLKNLFLSGATGLGKTFLSGCIAREVSDRGFSVVYDTAINLFSAFEAKKFSRDMGEGQRARDDTRRYLNCDLLILDDLGSELTTPFVQSALYELINSRLVSARATIISSNLTMDDVRGRYSPQVVSRLAGEYRTLPFFGEDIRLRK
jgi:DNA replication protein DnaC